MKTVQFREWTCMIVLGEYGNGRTAIQLVDVYNGEPIAVGSVNIPDYPLPDGHVLIKDWSENEGMYQALLTAGVISPAVNTVPAGFTQALECKFLGIH